MAKMTGSIQSLRWFKTSEGDVEMEKTLEAAEEAGRNANCLYFGGALGELLRIPFADRCRLMQRLLEEIGSRKALFVECGASSQEETMQLLALAAQGGAAGVSVITPMFFGVTEAEMLKYYRRLAAVVTPEQSFYVRCDTRLSNNTIHPNTLRLLKQEVPLLTGVLEHSTDAIRLLAFSALAELSLVCTNESILPLAEALSCDAIIVGT